MKNAALLLGLGALVASCRPGATAEAVRPAAPTGAQALEEDKPAECRATSKYVEPLVVDWKSNARTDLELAMKDGLAVVKYDCGTFELLKSCRVKGGYTFASVSRKEDTVQIVGRDELAANLPLGAVTLGAQLARGSSIDIALVTVGKQRTNVDRVARPELAGDCDGATHFVRAAFVGAFALGKGSSGVVRTAAELFGVGTSGASESSKLSVTKDGDLAACRNSKTTDMAPPSQCESALRVELLPIAAEKVAEAAPAQASVPPAAPLENPCPAGLVRTGEKCAEPGKGPFQCNEDAPAVCDDQCKAGNAASCFNLAAMLNRGDKLPRDAERAQSLFRKACEGGNAQGCLYSAYSLHAQKDKLQREKYYGQACELGSAMACRVLGEEVLNDDPAKGLSLLGRGCALADNFACGRLGFAHIFGKAGISKDVKKGLGILEGSCERGNWRDCWSLGRFLTRCEASRGGLSKVDSDACSTFEAPDPVRGAIALERACNNGGVAACFEAGWFLHRGKNSKPDLVRARMMYERACPKEGFNWDGCMALGEMYEKGEGVTADPAKAVVYYEQVCSLRMLLGGKACVRAAGFYEKGQGVPRNQARALELWGKACVDDGYLGSCDTYGKMLEKAGRKDDALGMYKDKCLAMKDPALCDSYKRLGGTLPADFKTFRRTE